jgi:hypothetical protein
MIFEISKFCSQATELKTSFGIFKIANMDEKLQALQGLYPYFLEFRYKNFESRRWLETCPAANLDKIMIQFLAHLKSGF